MDDLLRQGRKALAIGAWEEARDVLEEAVRLEPSAEALEELAWAYWWLNDMPQVFETRTDAHKAFLAKDDKHGASRTASWMGLTYLEYSGEFAVASGWFQRAESLLEGIAPCKEYCLIRTLKASITFRVDQNIGQALALLDETIAMCKSLQHEEGFMLAEALKGFILVSSGMVKEGMELLDEATLLAVGDYSGDINSITTTCCFLIDACQRVRDYDRAGQWCIKVKEICKRWRHKAVFAYCRTQYAAMLIWRGEYEEAELELTTALEELAKFRPGSVSLGRVRLADLRRRQGRWVEAATLFEQVRGGGVKALPSAELFYDQGEIQSAHDLTESFLRKLPLHEKTQRIAGLELFIRINVNLGRLDVAANSVRELEEIVSMIHTPPLLAACLGAKAILHAGRGDYDAARKDLLDAIDLYDQLHCPFEAGRLRMLVAITLDKLGQHAQAEAELNAAIHQFKALGAKRDLEKARQQLKALGTGNESEHGLTRRELDILKQVAEGKNNEQISDTLCISLRTVEKHLSNIYEKLGISGKSARAYAASFASKNL